MLQKGSFIKVWEIKKVNLKSVTARISCSEKKEDGSYDNVFSGFATLYGDEIKNGTTYKVANLSLTSSYDKDSKVSYQNIFIKVEAPSNKNDSDDLAEIDADDLPFYK